MEARVAIPEEGFRRIELKLDKLVDGVAELKARVAEIKGHLSAMPSAETFGEIRHALGKLEGRVDSLPTTSKTAGLIAIAVGNLALLAKWPEVLSQLSR
jgi:hypothetical protein